MYNVVEYKEGDFMYNIIQRWLKKEKDIILCIHGFGRIRSKEFSNFAKWYKTNEILAFDIFELEPSVDCNSKQWILRCENMVQQKIKQGYRVSLIGFSMGGVIATHLAKKYPIHKLFLIAPAFHYLHIGNVVGFIKNIFNGQIPSMDMSTSYTTCFMRVVKQCKESIVDVSCPVCLVHGNHDEIIPLRSSIHAYNKIKHQNKKLFILQNGTHDLMNDMNCAWDTFLLFKNFMSDELFTTK